MQKEYLILNSKHVIYKDSVEGFILLNLENNIKKNISQNLYNIISCFKQLNNIEELKSQLDNDFNIIIEEEELKNIIKILKEKRILVEYKQQYNKNGLGIFGVDILPIQDILEDKDNSIVCLGFPYELGISGKGGCKFGPSYIRKGSRRIFDYNYFKDVEMHNNYSFFGEDRKEYLLKLYDLGNICTQFSQKNGEEFIYLKSIINLLLINKKIPLTLGGDHSISISPIESICSYNDNIGIIHFDAHSDYGGPVSKQYNRKKFLHHGNFLSWIIDNPNIKKVYQFGIRENSILIKNEKISFISSNEDYTDLDLFIDKIDTNLKYYVTFDVDCLDPSIIHSTGTPLPNGFSQKDIYHIISKLFPLIKIVGIDVVELGEGNFDEDIIVSGIILKMLTEISKRYFLGEN